MREIKVSEVTEVIAKLCMDACYYLPQEMMDKIKNAINTEESPLGREILSTLVENFELVEAAIAFVLPLVKCFGNGRNLAE